MNIKPERIKKGDKIGVITPSNLIDEDDKEAIEASKKMFEDAGYIIEFSKNSSNFDLGYDCSAKLKADDINEMFGRKDIKIILCAKGGQNSNNTFDYIDFNLIKENPKIICGFSDSTSLTNVITEKTGLITFSGATFKSVSTWETDYSFNDIINKFEKGSKLLGYEDDEFFTIKEGIAEGELVGGNLSLTTKLVKGKYELNFENKILFIEELGWESDPLLVSSNLYFMKQNDVFDKIKGIWIGNYEHESGVELEKIVLDVLGNEYNFPIIKSNNFGHTDRKNVVPTGAKAKIDTSKKVKIELLEDCIK